MDYKKYFILMSLLLISVTGCQNNNNGPLPEVDDYVPVYVMAGQSNMEGSTFFDNGKNWLRNEMDAMG